MEDTLPPEPRTVVWPPAFERFLERLVLFTASFSRETAAALLEGLEDAQRSSAQHCLEHLLDLTSAERQAKLVRAFGAARDDEAERSFRLLVCAAPVAFRPALTAALPPFQRSGVDPLDVAPAPFSLPMGWWAERLVREVSS